MKPRMISYINRIIVMCIWIFAMACGTITESQQLAKANSDTIKKTISFCITPVVTYDTLAIEKGDLNSDNISDMVIVLKRDGEDTSYHSPPKRPMQIWLGQNDSSYNLFCSSDNVVMTHNMGGASNPEPFDGIKIEHGILIVEHHGGAGSIHWAKTVRFRYSPAYKLFCVASIRNDGGKFSDIPTESFERTTIEKEKDFGQITFDQYNIFDQME